MAYYSRSVTDAERSVNELLRAAEMEPENAEVQFGLAMAYRNRLAEGDQERAIKALERTLALDPDQPSAYMILGRSYLEAGDREAAIGVWRELAERTDDPEIAAQIREGLRELEAAP
jgi:cytochrome c-type biogenesis protein CcmH/NrfG